MTMTSLHSQSCSECGITFKGRRDKKFCSDQCRALFHNRQRKNKNNLVDDVNKVLIRNRSILSAFNPTGKTRVPGALLESQGFDFSYFTSIHTNKKGERYFYCYEHGYLPVGKDDYILVIKSEV